MPRQYRALACRCGICDPSASAAACPASVFAAALSPVLSASLTASISRSSIAPRSSGLPSNAAVSTASAPGRSPACSRSSDLARISGGMDRCPTRRACGSAATRWSRAAAGSFRWKLIMAVMPSSSLADDRLLQVRRHGFDLGQRVVPPSGLEEQLAEHAVRLAEPDGRADLVGELPRALGGGERLVVPVEVEQRDGLVDLQQQPEVGQPRVGLGHGETPVVERQRVGQVAGSVGTQRQHVQRPARRPGVIDLLGRGERAAGLPVGRLQLAEVQIGARGQHQQSGAVLGRQGRARRAPGRGS